MKHILLVDDNLTNLKQAASLLKEHYKVSMVKSGEDALEFLEKQTPDLILMDVEMPNMNGYEATTRIKNTPATSRIPVIFLTGDNEVESEVKGFECGAVDYMTKPFTKEIMLRRVALHLELFSYQQNLEMVLEEKTKELMETLAQTERIKAELDLAGKLQQSMLPREFPQRNEFSLFAKMTPAKEIGGDMYDFFIHEDRYLVMSIGDASGKGIGAALFMTQAKMMLGNALRDVLSKKYSLERTMWEYNNNVCYNNSENLFLTLFVAIVDLETGEMVYANAGHNPPMIRMQDSEFKLLPCEQNFIIGGLENTEFKTGTLQLEKDTRIFFYTDGVTESFNPKEELYGEERLMRALEVTCQNNFNISIAADYVFDDIDTFAEGLEQPDDITVLLFHYKG